MKRQSTEEGGRVIIDPVAFGFRIWIWYNRGMGFFKAYDMRGTFGVDFDLDTVYKVGRALPAVVPGKRWLVGRDCRTTSSDVRDALVAGLADAGVEVTDLGLCTTPMVYFFTAEDGYDGSVMITASHNPPGDNGLKVSMKTALPVGYANGLGEVEKKVEEWKGGNEANDLREQRNDKPSRRSGTDRPTFSSQLSTFNSHLSRYIAWQIEKSRNQTFRQLRYAIDCSNGVASILAHEIFPSAIFINDTLDGTFPNHSPNPLKQEAREQIAKVVREQKLDCGIIFDGDADRAMFVDENGDFIQPDYLIPIVARATIGTNDELRIKNDGWRTDRLKVIHDVRTSRGAIEALREMGCEPVMVPVGHAFAKPILRECGAVCGGELAGHYYFREFYGCDSGVLAATRVLGEIAKAKAAGRSFSEMMKPIMSRYANSGELNFKVEDKDAAIARVLAKSAEKLPPEIGRETMDGIRIEYKEGWINVRKSNTEPYLRMLVEAKDKAMLDEWVRLLTGAINDEK